MAVEMFYNLNNPTFTIHQEEKLSILHVRPTLNSYFLKVLKTNACTFISVRSIQH